MPEIDYMPLLDLLTKRLLAERLILAFPPNRVSGALRWTAHGFFSISEHKLLKAQMPDVLTNEAGYELRRPEHWR